MNHFIKLLLLRNNESLHFLKTVTLVEVTTPVILIEFLLTETDFHLTLLFAVPILQELTLVANLSEHKLSPTLSVP